MEVRATMAWSERSRCPGRAVRLLLPGSLLLAIVLGPLLVAQSPVINPGTDIPNVYPTIRDPNAPYPMPPELEGVDRNKQSDADVKAKSAGCVQCHQGVTDPHDKTTVRLGCTDCHGGDAKVFPAEAVQAALAPRKPGGRRCPAGPTPRDAEAWRSSAGSPRATAVLNGESPEFVRFVNPGDLRINHLSCGTVNCHAKIVLQERKSLMSHGCTLFGAALYNNGAALNKVPRFGEFFGMRGVPLRAVTVPPPTSFEAQRGVLPALDPLGPLTTMPRDGKPASQLSLAGLDAAAPLNPTLHFPGSNDHSGDFHQGGCSACHVVYANDRSPIHSSSRYAKFGNHGFVSPENADPTIPKNEPGHPILHRFAMGGSIPSSQCLSCHVESGGSALSSYLGYVEWDHEADGEWIYPADPAKVAGRTRLGEEDFLVNLTALNPKLKHTQFADFHNQGCAFRAVFRRDRKGNYLDYNGANVLPTPETMHRAIELPAELARRYFKDAASAKMMTREECQQFLADEAKARAGVPMHLLDVHLEKGMHCVDCHFVQDVHGNNRLQMEGRAGCEIQCIDCHGTATERARLRTTGPAAYTSNPEAPDPEGSIKGRPSHPLFGRDLAALKTPAGRPRFERRGDKVYQRSMVEPDLVWEIVQTRDTIDPTQRHYNPRSAMAKTVHFIDGEGDKLIWGSIPANARKDDSGCAHANQKMSCIACHSSWNPSCTGCHLKRSDAAKNLTALTSSPQTLRDDVFMLARDGTVTGNRVCPARSACAIQVTAGSDVARLPISGEGFSGLAFSTNVPHTVSGPGTTKQCTDCHVSTRDDNNAIMAQLLMQGTNYLNFIGRRCWLAAGAGGLLGVGVAEGDEPAAAIGSTLHRLAYPDRYAEHEKRRFLLPEAKSHAGRDLRASGKIDVLAVQARGDRLYAVCGAGGVRLFDIGGPNVELKGVVPTLSAAALALPSTVALDPARRHYIENAEGRIHALYGYVYVADQKEGLIVLFDTANTPLRRSATFNPDGALRGACAVTLVGTYAYVCADAGLVVISLDDPTHPEIVSVVSSKVLPHPHGVQCQFRYAYVVDEQGVKVLDITDLAHPRPITKLAIPDVRNLYLARTYAYLAAGKRGLIILDIENPEVPRLDQVFTADGIIDDLRDVKLGITGNSIFAYLADGKNGLRVVQLTSPETPGYDGFSPRPIPQLIATYRMPQGGQALAVSKGIDRDRAVDESGNQISVFGRLGARPFTLEEMQKLYLRNGRVWKVSDDPNWSGYLQMSPPVRP
jgi:hypothetical protein